MAVAALVWVLDRLETRRTNRLRLGDLASDMRTCSYHPRMDLCSAVAKACPWEWRSAKLVLGSTELNSPYMTRDAS